MVARGRVTLVVAVSLLASPAFARHDDAGLFLRQHTPRSVRRALCSAPEGRPSLEALRRVLSEGALSRNQLGRALSNPLILPVLHDTLCALPRVASVPGCSEVIERLADAKVAGNVRGAALELQVGAALLKAGHALTRLSYQSTGGEHDGRLADGTVVSIKAVNPVHPGRTARAAREQLERETQGRTPAMLVVGKQSSQALGSDWQHMAQTLGVPLRVLTYDVDTRQLGEVFSGGPLPSWLAPSR